MTCRKNTAVENEFMDSEKIAIEEASGHQNVKADAKANGPCSGITLRAKALRVMLEIGSEAPFQALSPRPGRKILICFNFHVCISKISSFQPMTSPYVTKMV